MRSGSMRGAFDIFCSSASPQSRTVFVVLGLIVQQKCNISCADEQTSLNNSSKAFANQHAVAPVKTCRLFPLFEWTPAGTFDAVLALHAFILSATSHTCFAYKKCKSYFICQSQASSEGSLQISFLNCVDFLCGRKA